MRSTLQGVIFAKGVVAAVQGSPMVGPSGKVSVHRHGNLGRSRGRNRNPRRGKTEWGAGERAARLRCVAIPGVEKELRRKRVGIVKGEVLDGHFITVAIGSDYVLRPDGNVWRLVEPGPEETAAQAVFGLIPICFDQVLIVILDYVGAGKRQLSVGSVRQWNVAQEVCGRSA